MFLAWSAFYEGITDAAYLNVIIPRLLDTILLMEGSHYVTVPETPALTFGLLSRDIEHVAEEMCQGKEAYHLVFIHADTGGRALAAGIRSRREAYAEAASTLCNLPQEGVVFVSPRHETEAWALAEPDAICRALGYRGDIDDLNLPRSGREADRIVDPKAVLERAACWMSGRSYRRISGLLTSIAQEQSIEALQTSPSFQRFESNVRAALIAYGFLR